MVSAWQYLYIRSFYLFMCSFYVILHVLYDSWVIFDLFVSIKWLLLLLSWLHKKIKLWMKLKHHKKICGNEWSSYLGFFRYSLVLILKRKRLPGADQSAVVRVVLLQLISIDDGAVGVTDLDAKLPWPTSIHLSMSPIHRQAISWTSGEFLSIGPSGTNFNEILVKIQNFSLTKMHLKMYSAKITAILSRGWRVKWDFQRQHDIQKSYVKSKLCQNKALS